MAADDLSHWRIGLVGYGEVGRILAEDLRAQATPRVSAYDTKLGGALEAPLREHADQCGVKLTTSHRELASDADLVGSAVTASQAVPVAAACAPALRRDAFFLDLNSASPGAKRRAARLVDGAGGRYVEAAVMTAVGPYRLRVPMLLGGPHAATLAPLLNAKGFEARVASGEIGKASATKMCRSVIVKGLEAMVVEAFTAARGHGVEGEVLASLAETFPGIDWEKQGAYIFERVIRHGRRRAEEMQEVAETVREVGLEPWSARATAERQAWVADLVDQGVMGVPDGPRADWRVHADRILGPARQRGVS
jgi:3-hydroxyisobutyrate dehydrogenase-like beta-hydroxyacid dehydrogenase